MRSWEQRESARTGKPVPQVLAELLEQSGGKWETIGLLMRHLSDKTWFADIRAETFQLILDAQELAA